MSDRARAIALALVEAGVHLRPERARSSVLDWIAELAATSSQYEAARLLFEELSQSACSVNTAGHQMAFEFGRSGYELGVCVGLRLRGLEDGSGPGSDDIDANHGNQTAADRAPTSEDGRSGIGATGTDEDGTENDA